MKNIILTTAIAVICAAPLAAIAADHNLYGEFRASVNSVDDTNGGVDGLSVQDNVSLFGLKGKVGDKDGIQAFYHLQTGAPAGANKDTQAFNQRFFFAGIQGSAGKLAYGRMTNAYKFAGFILDPFYNMSHVNANGVFASGGATFGLSPATNGFTDGSAQYTSPSFAGVKVNASLYIDPSNEDEHGMGAGLTWTGGGANVGIQYIANGDTAKAGNTVVPGLVADGSAIRLYGGYKGDSFSVAGSFETLDNKADDDPTYIYLTGTFNMSEKTRLVGSLGVVGKGAAGKGTLASAEGTGFTLAAFQTVAPKTELYVQYSAASLDDDSSNGDPSVIAVGAIHKFGFGG
jgi:hypothetical protein